MTGVDPIPVVLCIDVEPDARHLDPAAPSPWDGFAGTRALLERFRARAAARGGAARFAWYLRMDPQVERVYGSWSWIVDAHQAAIQALQDSGDHLGLHVHACRWTGGQHGWLIDYGDQPWIDECLTGAFDAFHRALGRRCTTFRFGDHWMSQSAFERIEALGADIDLTIEPGYDATQFYDDSEPISGVLPDYRGVPERLYRPSAADYRVEDRTRATGLWELPVTTASVRPTLAHRLYRRFVSRRAHGRSSPALVSHEPSLFSAIVDEALGRTTPHLVLTLRTGAVQSARYAARIERNLSRLLSRPEADRFRWTTPAEAVSLLTQRVTPQSGMNAAG